MTPQDRELFDALLARHARLEEALLQLRIDFQELEHRAALTPAPSASRSTLPPLPTITQNPAQDTPPSPPIDPVAVKAPPVDVEVPVPLPPVPEVFTDPISPVTAIDPQGGLEFQFGRWLARIGVVLGLITLISFSTLAYKHFHHLMGPWSKLTVLAVISIGMVATGLRLERRDNKLIVYGRTLAGGGLACLYYTLYGATYVTPLQVIHSTLLGGFLLLGWSSYVLYLAEKKKSELLSVFAIALAYFSSAITPVGDFTMVANLILSLTAVIFLIRNSWTGLSYLCLIGTYLGLLRQFVVNDGTFNSWFELSHDIAFWPAAIYLAGAWVIYTAGIFLAQTPAFAAGKRMAFLCLNNGAFIGLLTTAAFLSDFGHIGAILVIIGSLFLAASYLARTVRADATEIAEAYLVQGLALVTGGLVIVYSGVTRGLIITVESVFLAAAGAFSRNRIFRYGGCVSAFFGVAFLLDEISPYAAHPWILIFGGTAAMLVNAWFARRDFWSAPSDLATQRFVATSAYYVLLAVALLGIGLTNSPLHEEWTPSVMALIALILTFSVYLVPLFELPLVIQLLLFTAIGLATIPLDDSHPWRGEAIVGSVTLLLAAWWARQKMVRTGNLLQPSLVAYALATVALSGCAVHPHVDTQGWLVATSLLALAFLAYGSATRLWQFIGAGQVYLALAIWTFLDPPFNLGDFPWTPWAAALPPAVVFATGWLAQKWLPHLLGLSEPVREQLRLAALFYQALALALTVRWIFGIVPADHDTLALFFLATSLVLWNAYRANPFGVRSGLVICLVGACNYYYSQVASSYSGFTWSEATAFALFVAQPAILRYLGRNLVSEAESWAVIVLSSGITWLFISQSVDAANGTDTHTLTLAWGIYALALTVIGFLANERRQRWCGLFILAAAIVRVAVYDFWRFSDLNKVLTFFALTVICLGLSFLYYKFADRLKEWL